MAASTPLPPAEAEPGQGGSANKRQAKLAHGSITGHLLRQTAPAIVGVAAIMSVGIIDAYFIGQLGKAELAAVAFIFPVITALQSLGVGVMVGINSVVSRALGEGDHDRALARANLGMILGMVTGILLGLLLFAVRQPLFRLMQADAQVLPLIDEYMAPYALGFPLMMAMMAMNGVLRGQGAAKSHTAVLVTYSAANWMLDPLLITGAFGMEGFGVAGAAYATIGGWAIAIVLAFWLLGRHTLPFSPAAMKGCNWRRQLAAISRVAGPAAFTNSINPAGLAILTSLLAVEGQAAVAGFGAGGRLQSFAVVPLLALSGSIGSIVGQNWGAMQYDRARAALMQAALFSIGYGAAAALVLYLARGWFAELFSDDPQVLSATTQYLAISVWGYAGYGMLVVVNGALNAIDRAANALALSICRVLLVMVPVAWLARDALGTQAIYIAEVSANLLGGVSAAAIAWWVLWRRPDATAHS
ncbi:sodium transporter [Aurantiacibacter atlanticus]|uniref:Sodium transporter n=1 Tax=Aurantiacibacter atlanticus TaxID=1648404 RepID=A0A0H4VJZ3_9SPHN|nr:MATE family efflux transporter [Aurantiacibacter atlanticus]AKQ43186.2 sodium transporter [Aurantiacibacter atlanticus]MDF1833282.1 MATE family efflux transporter [Alteraurantiacibacter sp. bin_em_oilr2.035]